MKFKIVTQKGIGRVCEVRYASSQGMVPAHPKFWGTPTPPFDAEQPNAMWW